MLSSMKTPMISLLALAATGALFAQYDVPEPRPPNADQVPIVNTEAPLASLDAQLGTAVFDQRGAFASAFDEANRQVDVQVAQLRARGLVFADPAAANLANARDEARVVFRDLSLTTEETWQTARHNAINALRKVQDALVDLEKTATRPQE
jgi:hypothetical protein